MFLRFSLVFSKRRRKRRTGDSESCDSNRAIPRSLQALIGCDADGDPNRFSAILLYCDSTHFLFVAADFLAMPDQDLLLKVLSEKLQGHPRQTYPSRGLDPLRNPPPGPDLDSILISLFRSRSGQKRVQIRFAIRDSVPLRSGGLRLKKSSMKPPEPASVLLHRNRLSCNLMADVNTSLGNISQTS